MPANCCPCVAVPLSGAAAGFGSSELATTEQHSTWLPSDAETLVPDCTASYIRTPFSAMPPCRALLATRACPWMAMAKIGIGNLCMCLTSPGRCATLLMFSRPWRQGGKMHHRRAIHAGLRMWLRPTQPCCHHHWTSLTFCLWEPWSCCTALRGVLRCMVRKTPWLAGPALEVRMWLGLLLGCCRLSLQVPRLLHVLAARTMTNGGGLHRS